MGYLCKLDNIHTIINEAKKEVNYAAIDEYYNSELSVSENLKVLQDNGVSVSRRTLYRYCADRGIKVCYSDSDIIAMLNANDSVRGNLATLKDNGVKIGSKRVAKLLKQLKEGKVDNNECSEAINEGGSNCPTDKVTDTLSSYRTTILYKNGTITTPTNQPSKLHQDSNVPTQSDIIDNMQAYLMQLENEINNETTEEDMELKLKTPSFGQSEMDELEKEFNNDTTNEDTNTNTDTDDIRGWKFDFGVFGRSNDAMNF